MGRGEGEIGAVTTATAATTATTTAATATTTATTARLCVCVSAFVEVFLRVESGFLVAYFESSQSCW